MDVHSDEYWEEVSRRCSDLEKAVDRSVDDQLRDIAGTEMEYDIRQQMTEQYRFWRRV